MQMEIWLIRRLQLGEDLLGMRAWQFGARKYRQLFWTKTLYCTCELELSYMVEEL